MKSISVDFLKNWLITILLFVVIVLSDAIGQKNKELKEKVDLLMDKYNFIFDKSVSYDIKIQEFIKLKTGKVISLERIRSMISGNSIK